MMFADMSERFQKLALDAGWTAEREQRLAELYQLGMSMSEIAADLVVTKGAIVGKISRLGLTRETHNAPLGRPPKNAPASAGGQPYVSPWTADKIAQLRDLHGRGLSDQHVATAMGAPFTRYSVHDKRRRLGLPGNHPQTAPPQPKALVKIASKSVPVATAPAQPKPTPEILIDAQPLRLTLAELRNDSCRWPLGDPSDLTTFRYCGATVDMPGVVPYCGGHCRLAYQPRAA